VYTPHNPHSSVVCVQWVVRRVHASQHTQFSFKCSKTPAGSNLGEHYQIL